jgi:hypothetical protein
MGCRHALALCQKPGSKHGKGREGDSTNSDVDTPMVVISGSTASGSVSTVRVGVGSGVSTKVGITGNPTVIAQGLVPQEVGLGGVFLFNASEEVGVLAVAVSVDSTNSCNVRVEFGSRLCTRLRVHRKVEGFLYRSTRLRGLLVNVRAGVFSKASVRLLRGE